LVAAPDDVIKLTTCIVDYSPDKLPEAFPGFGGVINDREHSPANTLIDVQPVFQPHILLEVEEVAAVEI